MATHSSIPWRLPWAEEPGRPQPMGSQESDRPPSPVLSRCWYLKVWHWFRSSQKESFHAKNQGCVLYHAKYLVKLSPTTYLERYESSLWFWKQSKYLVLTSVAKSCPTLCDPEDWSTPGFPVHHQLLEFTQTHIESVMSSSHLILCRPLLLLLPIPPSIRVFSNESVLCMRWPKYWSFSFSIIPSKEHPGLISFRMDWLDLLAVQGTFKSLLHHSSKASIFQYLFFSF